MQCVELGDKDYLTDYMDDSRAAWLSAALVEREL